MTTEITDDCRWQQLMNTAYDRWQDNDRLVLERRAKRELSDQEARKLIWGLDEHLLHCSDEEREACLLGNLNQQIENGGVIQWVDNGYAHAAIQHGLFRLLDTLGPISRVISEFLRGFCEDWMDEDGEIKQYEDEDDAWEQAFKDSDRLSDRFYELQEHWHPEVQAHIG